MPDTTKPDRRSTSKAPDPVPTSQIDPFALARLFNEWIEGDEAEQRETFELLRRCLDEDRPAGYKLFS